VGADAGPTFSRCASGELAGLIERLDDEFIPGRGRTVSLAARFPRELSASNLDNLLVARQSGEIAGAIVVKRFRWIVPEREYAGAMLGMVWIAPKKRGAGLGLKLLSHVGVALQDSVDFAVLWTGNPAFYARAGWKSADHGNLGRIDGNGQNAASRAAMDFERARAIWRRQPRRVERDASWQPPLPPAAESLELFEGTGAYALAGRREATLYCYEILGDETGFAAILDSMRASCAALYFNENTGSPSHTWLSRRGVSWEKKPLAMWLPACERNPSGLRGDWYVPWLDRI
jgi:predicted N-acetyltransferase YhbS